MYPIHTIADDSATIAAPAVCVRIVLVVGVRLYREGLAAELRARAGLSVVGLAADFTSAVSTVASTRPDVVLLDAGIPRTAELVRTMRSAHQDVRIVAFAVDDSERGIDACAEAGVTSFVTRDVTVDELANAVVATARDELACSPKMAAILFRRVTALSSVGRAIQAERSVLASLTSREREIASLLAAGRSNKDIGRSLHIEVTTVKNHVHRILEKLQVSSRAEVGACVRVCAERAD